MTDHAGRLSLELPPVKLGPVVVASEGWRSGGVSYDPDANAEGPIKVRLVRSR